MILAKALGLNPPEMISWENNDITATDALQAKALDTFFHSAR
jgi:hypothetical protein